jgi:hypothetical protein
MKTHLFLLILLLLSVQVLDAQSLLWKYGTGSSVWSVSISSDGSYIAAGSKNGYVYLFTRSSSSPPQQQIPPPPEQAPEQKSPVTKTPASADILYLLPILLLAIPLVFIYRRRSKERKEEEILRILLSE